MMETVTLTYKQSSVKVNVHDGVAILTGSIDLTLVDVSAEQPFTLLQTGGLKLPLLEAQEVAKQVKKAHSVCIIKTYNPFVISDYPKNQVVVLSAKKRKLVVESPENQTFGASINMITMTVLGIGETIGPKALKRMHEIHDLFQQDKANVAYYRDMLHHEFGESIEMHLLDRAIRIENQTIEG